jgi:isopenicillin-N epimerase
MMRDAFLLDPTVVFLNHGSFGACPKEVFAQFQHWQLELERNPVEFLGRRSAGLLFDARTALATYLNTRAQDLVFVPNATTGTNIVARSLVLQPGDEVLSTDHEYGACDATWRFVCDKVGAHYRKVEIPLPLDAATFASRVMAAVTPRTRLIFASHITSTTALIFPVAELCAQARERGVLTLIDGAHAPGHITLDLAATGADFYTGNCHKWLCAPKGSAFLQVRPELQALIEATVVSWGYLADTAGHTGFDGYTGHTTLERRLQWQGTRDIAAYLAVPAAIDFWRRHDGGAWRQRCHELACHTQRRVLANNGLQALAPDASLGQMAAMPVRCTEPEVLRQRLFGHHRIEVPVTQHGKRCCVRVSVQAYNTAQDLDTLVQALNEEGA